MREQWIPATLFLPNYRTPGNEANTYYGEEVLGFFVVLTPSKLTEQLPGIGNWPGQTMRGEVVLSLCVQCGWLLLYWLLYGHGNP